MIFRRVLMESTWDLLCQVPVIYSCLPCVHELASSGLWPTVTIPVRDDPDAAVPLGSTDEGSTRRDSGLSGLHPPKEVLSVINIWMSHYGCSNGRLFPVPDPGKRIWGRWQRSKHKTCTGELAGCEVEGAVWMPEYQWTGGQETGASKTRDSCGELRVTVS